MLQWAALHARKDGTVYVFGERFGAEDAAASGAAHRLVGGESDRISIGGGVGMDAAHHEAGDVGCVKQEVGAHFVGDGAKGGGVDDAGVGGGAGDDELGLLAAGGFADLSVIQAFVAVGDGVGDEFVELSAEIDGRAVSEVAAVIQAEAHHLVAGREERQIDGHVGIGA